MAIFLSFDHVDRREHSGHSIYNKKCKVDILLFCYMPWIWQYEIRSLTASLGCRGTICNLCTEIVLINVESTFWVIVYV
jgi:hypothetical protein